MDFKRIIIYLALALVGVSLWNAWQHDYPSKTNTNPSSSEVAANAPSTKTGEYTPPSYDLSTPGQTSTSNIKNEGVNPASMFSSSSTVAVNTDVLNVQIDLQNGAIVSAKLPKFPVSLSEKNNPVQLLNSASENLYIAQTGITSTQEGSKVTKFTTSQSVYSLSPDQNELNVVLTGQSANGLKVVKTFQFKRGDYAINTEIHVTNKTNQEWSGSFYNQIVRKNVSQSRSIHSRSYNGAAISSSEKPYEQISFKTMDKEDLSRNIENGWVAMQQQYFLSAWVPQRGVTAHFYSHVTPDPNDPATNIYTIGYVTPKVILQQGQSVNHQSIFYVGPEKEDRLGQIAKGLDLTVDYGLLWPISKLLFWVMEKIHNVIGNWGWSIVLVTLLIKIVFYPFSNKSFKSMMKMRALQPQMEALKERYKDDKQGMSKAMMELYKKEKVNPMSGCLPMIIQIPVFIALYYVLIASVELRQAPFILWIHDLSVKDPYYVLPILMGLSMVLQQKLSPQSPDPMQAKMMMLMPVFFTVFLLSFPSGLVLYWLTNNILTVLQQWFVMKKHSNDNKKIVKKIKSNYSDSR